MYTGRAPRARGLELTDVYVSIYVCVESMGDGYTI